MTIPLSIPCCKHISRDSSSLNPLGHTKDSNFTFAGTVHSQESVIQLINDNNAHYTQLLSYKPRAKRRTIPKRQLEAGKPSANRDLSCYRARCDWRGNLYGRPAPSASGGRADNYPPSSP